MTNSRMKHLWRLVTLGSLAAVLALGFGGPPPRVLAAADGVLEGDLVNKTAGGAIPANTPVELQAYKAMAAVENRAATADAAGHFRFDKLETGQEFSYQIIAHYKNTSYFSDITSLTTTPKPQPIKIDIYEPTTEFGAIHVERAHVIVEVSPRSLQFAQLYVLTNPGDRVYVGPAEDGSKPTLAFTLPAGATDLQFQQGALGERFQSTANGFVDTEPVVPGAGSQLVYRYRVPFSSTTASLAFTNAYSVTALNVLISDPKVRFASPGLANDGVRTVQNEQWQSYSGQNLPPGQVVQLNFEGLPLEGQAAPTGSVAGAPAAAAVSPGATPDLNRMAPWVVFGLLMFALGFGVGRFTPGLAAAPAAGTGRPAPVVGEEDLIVALADLDDAFERGEMDEDAYRRERARLKKGRKAS
jgi:hypothetical protein